MISNCSCAPAVVFAKRKPEKFSLAGIPQLHKVCDVTVMIFSAFNF